MLPILSLNAVDVGSESLSATLCPTKAFSEYTQRGNAAFRPRTCVGTAVEGCAKQMSQANAGETWLESQPPESGQD